MSFYGLNAIQDKIVCMVQCMIVVLWMRPNIFFLGGGGGGEFIEYERDLMVCKLETMEW